MIRRVFLLSFLLIIRCVLGWLETSTFRTHSPVAISGLVIRTYQYNSDCIMVLGRFLINSGKICAAKRRDEIRAFGTLEVRLIDSFGGRLWLVSNQIDKLDNSKEIKNLRTQDELFITNFRESLVLVFKKHVPEPEAGLMAGVVLGYKKDIGQEFYDRMIKSGSVHIAVASGYNILLVGGVVLSLCFWFWPRPRAVWVAILAMVFYAILSGGDPPVVRAVWMAGLMYLGQIIGRGNIATWILLFTAWVMLMIEPSLVVSPSFQLSVSASFGLMVIEPWLTRVLDRAWGSSLMALVGNLGVLTTVSTMLLTMPIIWWHFGRMSWIGILSNTLILPFVPPLMILGVGTLVVPAVFAWPAYAISHWIVLVVRFLGS